MSDIPYSRRTYSYRRSLGALELLPAIGVGVGVGMAAFYLMRLLLERTPLLPPPPGPLSTRHRPLPARP